MEPVRQAFAVARIATQTVALLLALSAPLSAAWVDRQVAVDSDDAEEDVLSGTMDLNSSDLELVSDPSNEQLVGMRFRNVNIPNGATITSAEIEFEVDETDSAQTDLTIYGQDADNPGQFAVADFDISSRTPTTATVAWNSVSAWNTVNAKETTPDLSTIVQEIVDRGGWSSGNAMVLIVGGQGERTAESRNGESAAAPLLRVTYTNGGGPVSISSRVDRNNDDAEESLLDGSINRSSSDLELGSEGRTDQLVGMRFTDIRIAQGTTISRAWLEFVTDETNTGTTSVTIQAEDVDDSATFTSTNGNISGRTLSTAAVDWDNLAAWNTVGEVHQSPDISSVVQEIIDRGGWSSGNDMSLIITGLGERTAESRDSGADTAAILRIELPGALSPPAATICYAVADSGDTLVTVPTSGAGLGNATSVGGTGTSNIEAIAFDPIDGNVYAANADRLGRLDRDTGDYVALTEVFGTGSGTIGGSPTSVSFSDVDGLSFDPFTNVLYGSHATASGNDLLFQIDHETGAFIPDAFGSGVDFVEITGTSVPASIDDIAIDPTDGTMYAVGNGTTLIIINRSSGAASVVGTISGATDVEGLGFDNSGTLYGTTGTGGAASNNNRLYSLPTSAPVNATEIGSGGMGSAGSDYEALDCTYVEFTRATIGRFEAHLADTGAVVEWTTLSEDGTLGFNLHRKTPGERGYTKLNDSLLPGLLHNRNGATYRFHDVSAVAGRTYVYKLMEREARRSRYKHGPYRVHLSRSGGPTVIAPASGFERIATRTTELREQRMQRMASFMQRQAKSRRDRREDRAKVLVSAPGIHHVSDTDLATSLGLPVTEIRTLIQRGRIQLRNRGRRVAISPEADGFLFYAEGIRSQYTDQNVYPLRIGRGTEMKSRRAAPNGPMSPVSSFRHISHAGPDRIPITHLAEDADADYWMWDFLLPGLGIDQRSFDISTPDPLSGARPARLRVLLHGGNATPAPVDHHVSISVNGILVGEDRWDGTSARELNLTVDPDLLSADSTTITVQAFRDTGVDLSLVYVNGFELDYSRALRADQGKLQARLDSLDSLDSIRFDAFESPDIRAWDISKPLRPVKLAGLDIRPDAESGYSAGLRLNRRTRHLLVLQDDAIARATVIADRPSKLRKRGRKVDYLIITAGGLLAPAERLAAYRSETQGLRGLVVDIEDIYDDFSHGIKDADAIWSLLAYAHRHWRRAPRYVLLAGDGSFDYRDRLGFGDSIIPTLLTPTPNGLFPSDNLYADVAGNDWIPEMAIGRVPVVDEAEFDAFIDKLIAYESATGDWAGFSLLAADAADAGGNFSQLSDRVAGLFPEGHQLTRVHLDGMSIAEGRQEVLTGIEQGLAFLNFVGHGAYGSMGNHGLLTLADVPAMGNAARSPVITAMTCLMGQFGFPGTDGLAEELLLHADGGAIAVWSPSGLSLNGRASLLDEGFYRATFQKGELVLGEAVRIAQAGYARDGEARYILDIFNLLGDPATIMK